MNIRDLEYFHQLAQLNSFTMAAKHFGVSQPTITYAVKRLEEQFDCDLFIKDPSHRSVVLTSEGQILDNHITAILSELAIAQKTIKRHQQEELQVGFPPIIRARILASLIDKGYSLDFLTKFQLSGGSGSSDLLTELLAGELDFSLLGSLEHLSHPKLVTKELYQKPFYIFMSEKHPLANSKELSFAQLLDQPFILLDEGHVHLEAFRQLNARHHNAAQILFNFNEPLMVGQMVKENLGITFLTDFVLFSQLEGLVKIPLVADEQYLFHVSYAYPKEAVLTKDCHTFIDLLESIEL